MNFAILPSGAWGTAFAIHLRRLDHTVTLLPRELDEALEMAQVRENRRYLPGYTLDQNLQIGLEVKPAVMEADSIILACPSKFLRSVCREIRPALESATRLKTIIALCKGLELETGKLPAEIITEELPGYAAGVLSGPTFASQLAAGKPSALVLATTGDADECAELQEALSGQTVRIYASDDIAGVQLGGALKNVYAIAAGICDGLELGDNGKAALITRSLAEMVRIGQTLGGKPETFYGLSGFGDLMLTCNGRESRNRTFGERFAQGTSIEALIEQEQMTVEGYRTASAFHKLCLDKGIEAPILNEIHETLYKGKSPQAAVHSLMTRTLKAE